MAKSLPIEPAKLKEFIKANYKKMGAVEMARKIGVSLPTIIKYGYQAGVRVCSSLTPIVTKEADLKKRIDFIKANGKSMTAKEMAIALDIAEHSVYWMVKKYKLKYKPSAYNGRDKKKLKHRKRIIPKKSRKVVFFNVHEKWNWLVG